MSRRILLVALVTSACTMGTPPGKFAPARGAAGVRGFVELADSTGTRLPVELLAVEDTDLIALNVAAVVLIPFRAIAATAFDQIDWRAQFHDGTPPDSAGRAQLRLVSRFPQGLTPDLLQRLLASYGQSEPRVISK